LFVLKTTSAPPPISVNPKGTDVVSIVTLVPIVDVFSPARQRLLKPESVASLIPTSCKPIAYARSRCE
jgi:hypothetical protein